MRKENIQTESKEMVNHPQHYTYGKYEVIDIIQDSLSPEEFKGYCKGNILKYVMRSTHKGAEKQDLQKAEWYLHRLNQVISEEVE